jgi:hypothetical protein
MRMLARVELWRARTRAAVDRGGGGVGQGADWVAMRRPKMAEGGDRGGERPRWVVLLTIAAEQLQE